MNRPPPHPAPGLKVGDRVALVGDHPCAGRTGRYLRTDWLRALNRSGIKVALDGGGEVYVMQAEHVRRIPENAP